MALLLAAGLFFVGSLSVQAAWESKKKHTLDYVPGEVLVKFRTDTRQWEKDRALVGVRARRLGVAKNLKIHRLKIDDNVPIMRIVEELRKDPSVLFAEPNWRVKWLGRVTPNDPFFTSGVQWHLDTTNILGYIGTTSNTFSIDVDIDAPEAWGFMNSLTSIYDSSAIAAVGVLDSGLGDAGFFSDSAGYIPSHADIPNSNLFANTAEPLPADNFDDDGNTLVDDRNGWDWIGNDNAPADADTNNHGTFVSGIVGAEWNNSEGVASVGQNHLTILPLRTSSVGDIVEGIDYAISMVTAGRKVPVLNASWFVPIDSDSLRSAIRTGAGAAGIVLVAAAGNDGTNNDDTSIFYPAKYSVTFTNVLAVAASDSVGQLATFTSGGSNFGPTSVQIAAPGKTIASTFKSSPVGSRYGIGQGTSFAAPIAASTLALIMLGDSSLTPAQAIDRLIKGGYYDARLAGKVSSGKRVNLVGALAPFYPYSGLAPMGTTQSVSMYTDAIGALFGTIDSAVSSSDSIAVMATDSSGAWAVSPKSPGIATFTVTFPSGPVASMETGSWRVTGITPFTSRIQVGQTVDFEEAGSIAGTVTWGVDDTSVGTINSAGLFSAVGTGETIVILRVNGSAVDNSGPIVVIAATSTGGGGGGGGGWGCGTLTLPSDSSNLPGAVEFVLLALFLILGKRFYVWRVDRAAEA